MTLTQEQGKTNMDQPLDGLEMSVRLRNAIKINFPECKTVQDISNLTKLQFKKGRNIGKLTVAEMEDFLDCYGLSFAITQNTTTIIIKQLTEKLSKKAAENEALRSALQYAVEQYGKPGGPWNVPSDPGGWLHMAETALGHRVLSQDVIAHWIGKDN